MDIVVVGGAGHVGLVTAVCLASKGHLVFCFDIDKEKLSKIGEGTSPVYEEGLEGLLVDALRRAVLVVTRDLRDAIRNADISFICVGTPPKEEGQIDLSQVQEAAQEIGRGLSGGHRYHVVAVKSTVIPGTTEELVIPALMESSGKTAGRDFGVCVNPEFLREGSAVNDFLFPRATGIVIGELDRRSGGTLSRVYKGFSTRLLRTSIRAAEMIKYARNAYLAKDISFANELANICQAVGVDYLDVKRGMELDHRIGKGRFLNAGLGFGGSCFPKDLRALIHVAEKSGIQPRILEATLTINQEQPRRAIELLEQALKGLEGKAIAVLGLAFKPGTDDLRGAPSLKIVEMLVMKGANVTVYDPKAQEKAKPLLGPAVRYCAGAKDALADADACLLATEWPEFSNPTLYTEMLGKLIVDGRRVLHPALLPRGFRYFGVGLAWTGGAEA